MTHAGYDSAVIWLKQADNDHPNERAIWTTKLLPGRHTVNRSRTPEIGARCACMNCDMIGVFSDGPAGDAETFPVWLAPEGGTRCRRCWTGGGAYPK